MVIRNRGDGKAVMPDVDFSERAKELFLGLEGRKQGAVAAVIQEIKENPEEKLDSTIGYAEYGVEIQMNPEDFIICFDWDKEDEMLYVLTLGPASEIND
jgi:hypothetical protein